jgi:hypothetical protein
VVCGLVCEAPGCAALLRRAPAGGVAAALQLAREHQHGRLGLRVDAAGGVGALALRVVEVDPTNQCVRLQRRREGRHGLERRQIEGGDPEVAGEALRSN